jgi:hypothetical protein
MASLTGLGLDQPTGYFMLHEARVLAFAKTNEAPGLYSERPPLEIKNLGRYTPFGFSPSSLFK